MAGRCRTSILIYGDTGDGKTPMIGEYAEFIWRTEQRITRLYSADPGGYETIRPYVDLGIVDPVDCLSYPRPWEWLMAIAKGKVPEAQPTTGEARWVIDETRNAKTGVYAYEGFTGIADTLMQDLAKRAAEGRNIGGQSPAVMFQEGDTKIAGNSPAHFGNVQTQLTIAAQESFGHEGKDIVWTALARRASDNDTNAPILGPQIVGKALTSEVPRWFVYTFRIMGIPADPLTKQGAKHTLLFEDHTDITMPGAKGLGNSRLPLDAPRVEPVTPASLVLALEKIRSASREAEAKIRERLRGVPLPNEVVR